MPPPEALALSRALVAWAVLLTLWRFFRCDDVISQILAVGIVINIAAYLFSVRVTVYWSVREIAGIVPFGAVLAGRVLARYLMADGRLAARFRRGLVAALGYRALMRGRRVVVPGLRNKLLVQANRLAPRHIVTAVVRRLQETRDSVRESATPTV